MIIRIIIQVVLLCSFAWKVYGNGIVVECQIGLSSSTTSAPNTCHLGCNADAKISIQSAQHNFDYDPNSGYKCYSNAFDSSYIKGCNDQENCSLDPQHLVTDNNAGSDCTALSTDHYFRIGFVCITPTCPSVIFLIYYYYYYYYF